MSGKNTNQVNMTREEDRIVRLEDEVRLLKEQLEQLRSIREDLFTTLRSIGEAVIRTDAGGRIEWLNAAAVGMACIVNLKARNKPLGEVFRFGFDDAFTQPADLLAMEETQPGKPLQMDDMFMQSLADGAVYRVQCSVSPIYTGNGGGTLAGRVLVLKNLTDMYGAVQAAQENERKFNIEQRRLQTLGDNLPNGCLYRFAYDTVTGWMGFTYLSRAWETITGITIEEAVSNLDMLTERMHPDDRPVYARAYEKSLIGMEHFSAEMRFMLPSGEMRWGKLSSMPHREGTSVVWDGFLIDITESKTAELKLVTEKERLEAIGDNYPDGCLFRATMDTRTQELKLTYVSRPWEDLTGIPAEAVVNDVRLALGRIHPDDLPIYMADTIESAQTGENMNTDIRFVLDDGSVKWAQIASHPHTEGHLIVWDGFFLDITARKQTEFMLLAEKERLEAIGGNIPDGALYRFKANPATRDIVLDYVSDTWQTVIGIEPAEALAGGLSIFEGVDPADMPMLMERINDSLTNMTNFHVELRFRRPDGKMLWLLMSAKPSLHGDIIYVDGLIFDITARKEAEQKLFAEKERLRSIGDNMPDGVLYRSRMDVKTGRIWLEYVSATWEKISGVPVETALNDIDSLFARMEPDDLDELVRISRESIIDLTPFSFEFGYRHPLDGKTHRMRIASVPVADGDTFYADGTLFDVTESREAAAELEAYRRNLEHLVKERTEDLEAINEEFHATNNELHDKNQQLSDEIAARVEVMKKLEDSESKVRNFIRRSFEGILMMDGDGRIVEWNEAMSRITGISYGEAIGKYNWDLLRRFLPKGEAGAGMYDRIRQAELEYIAGGTDRMPVLSEDELFMPDGSKHYLQVSVFPIALTDTCYFGKILRDITERKQVDMELERYRTQLEDMVELKSRDLMATHNSLEAINRRQALFIKVLQILQMEPDVPSAMNLALAELGAYTGVDRLATWENYPDGVTYGCTHEWCNEGIEPAIQYLGSMTIEASKPWFDMLAKDDYICTSDMSTLHPFIQGMLEKQGVKAVAVFPMSILGAQFGFLSFNFCRVKEWDVRDVELMNQMAQIMSTATKRWQIETAFNRSRETMQKVLDNINANIFVTDYDTYEIIFANKRFREEAQCKVEGVACWQMLNAGLNCPCAECPRAKLLDSNRRSTGVHSWENCNKLTGRWYSIQSTAMQWIDGRWVLLELAMDISDRKEAEAELIRAKEKAEESDRLKSAFLANVSHEIRTPLNGITGFLHFLDSDGLSPEHKEYVKLINNSSTQLVKLIDDIIDVAKIEAQQLNVHPVPVDINSLMAELQVFFEAYMKNSGKEYVALILDSSGFIDNCVAVIDPTRLRQVLTNLLTNAVKFTEKGYIRFGYRQTTPDQFEFVVEDTGIGLAADQQKVIFERFRQVESGNGRFYGGAGLGLAISRSLVQLMGGDIRVDSSEGNGSTFYFTVAYVKG